MEEGEPSQRATDEEFSSSLPRGGPIFVPDLVSPLTRVPVFESQVFHELECLKAELGSGFLDLEEDISVDELKLRTDEDLVIEAMKIAFDGGEEPGTSDIPGNLCPSGTEDDQRMPDSDTLDSCESSGGLESTIANLKKRKRRDEKKPKSKNKRLSTMNASKKDKPVDESYLKKVDHLVKIRQKQDEDKASVELHSFNYRKKSNAAVTSGKVETLKCVESSSWPVQFKCSKTTRDIPIQYPEVVLCVEIYHHQQSWKKTQEFLVLGRQTLTELRDKIRCLPDVVMQKAVEENENEHPDIMYDPSGYFLIEELFCNDMRDPKAIDYSEPILDWLKNSKGEALAKWDCILSGRGKARKVLLEKKPLSKLPNFKSVDMDKTRFCDLGFRLGAGYLYCHQGDCKHVVVIRDMRLIDPEDVQNRAAYPLLVYQRKRILKKCNVCNIFKATKVTLDDKLAAENPCYFCDTCYFLLHYSKDGELLYRNFKVYDYLPDYC
ncbi:snRNA-activating protein complex subunit [Silene latifolia]|uniref:snRNA-activating protein complex subunit n=1 Tax=Silene latifolia TaxID=37657 RepID=UPI003D77F2FE